MASDEQAPLKERSIVITCMGTRGDVQPFVALGIHLRRCGWARVVLAAPPEFRAFITGHGLEHAAIGISLQHAINASPQGRALRTASMFTAFQATQAFFRLPLLESWFAAVRRLLLELRPACLLLTTFVAMSGAAALPQILGLPTRVVMAHTIPMHATGAFGVPLAGTGFSAPAAWLNRLQWRSLDVAVARTLHLPRAQSIVDAELGCAGGGGGAAPRTTQPAQATAAGDAAAAAGLEAARALLVSHTRLGHRDSSLAAAPVPTLYIWSPALLPQPADWPPNCHVVGPLLLRRPQPTPAAAQRHISADAPAGVPASLQQRAANAAAAAAAAAPAAEPPVGLPAALQGYLDAAARRQLPVVYIGLGSMLATVFEPDEVGRLVGRMAAAVERAAAEAPLCAVLHTTMPPAGHSASSSASGGSQGQGQDGAAQPAAGQLEALRGLPPYFLLRQAVPHELLLPQVDFAVHHGGAGTTQAVLLAGKPALVVPCVPSSDQPFWADLVARRGLGPPGWFPVRRVTAPRLAAGIVAGVRGLARYTVAAEAVAYEMAQEDGVAAAAAVIESCLAQ